MDGMIGSVPPSPELLAKVEALPPIKDEPRVDLGRARAADHRFTLRRLLAPIALALIAGLVLGGLDAAANLALPALVRGGIDSGGQVEAFDVCVALSRAGLAIVFADWLVTIPSAMVVGRNGERLLYTLRVKLFAQLQRLGLDFYERELNGRIMTRMTSDVDALSSFLQTGLVTMVSSLLTFVGVLAAMLVINVRLGLLVLAIVPVLAVVTVVFRIKSSRAYTEARERISVVNADLAENVAGLRVTQAFRREGTNRDRFAGRSFAYRESRLRAQRYIALYFPFVQALSTLASALVLVVAVGEVRSGALSVGALIAYLLYIDMVFSPIQQLSQVFDGYQQASVGVARIKDLLRLHTSTPSAAPDDVVPVPAAGFRGEITLRDVRFAYTTGSALSGGDENARAGEAISGVSFTIAPGETVALVGQTGAGKSTIVKLIARFYDVTGGSVLVDGVDVRSYDLAAFRHRLGGVPREAYLFSGTVADAIAYARPSASLAEIQAAAQAVGAHEMITHLPGGYDHEVGERGRNMSAGQRQLIALARAELADPDILLLDEATAALDLASEAAVNAATDALSARRTTIVVAQGSPTGCPGRPAPPGSPGRPAGGGRDRHARRAGRAGRRVRRAVGGVRRPDRVRGLSQRREGRALEQGAAVDGVDAAGHEAAGVGREQQGEAADLGRCAHPAEGDDRAPHRVGRGRGGLLAAEVGLERAGGDRVYPDAPAGQVVRGLLGEVDDGGLRDRVRVRGVGVVAQARGGGRGDDRAGALPLHVPRRRLHGVDDTVQVHVDQGRVGAHVHVVEPALGQHRRAAAGDARVGEGDVDPAAGTGDLVDRRMDRGGVAHVQPDAADEVAALRQVGHRALQRVGVPVRDDHGRARVGQDRRERVAEAGRPARDQGDLVTDGEQVVDDTHQDTSLALGVRIRGRTALADPHLSSLMRLPGAA